MEPPLPFVTLSTSDDVNSSLKQIYGTGLNPLDGESKFRDFLSWNLVPFS
jgi:hypothetical protein